MSAVVLTLGAVVARIAAAAIYRTVGGAAELERLAERGISGSPHAFVLPGAETSEAQGFAGGTRSVTVTASFSVISIAEDIRLDQGALALSALEETRGALIAALAGWRPAWAAAPVDHLRGQLVTGPMSGGLLGWQDDFQVRFRRTVTAAGD